MPRLTSSKTKSTPIIPLNKTSAHKKRLDLTAASLTNFLESDAAKSYEIEKKMIDFHKLPRLSYERGFTLVELSIVIVIIGLLVGGVLMGRDLIEAANTRNQISQIEQFRTAVNVFKNKYDYLPGDMPPAAATALGFSAGTGTAGNGNNDGYVSHCGQPQLALRLSCETALFWVHLSQAGLINGQFDLVGGTVAANPTPAIAVALSNAVTVDRFVPAARMGNDSYVVIFHFGTYSGTTYLPHHAFLVTGLQRNVQGLYFYNTHAAISPSQAYAMDTKIDDGIPFKGKVYPTGLNSEGFRITSTLANVTNNFAPVPSLNNCVDATAPYPGRYLSDDAHGCLLAFAF